jgi:hypothetical protein
LCRNTRCNLRRFFRFAIGRQSERLHPKLTAES